MKTFKILKTLTPAELAEMIRAKKLDTTIFSTIGAYQGQSVATILKTKMDDMKEHKLIRNSSGGWEIISEDRTADKEKGFCEWALKGLNEIDTRDFFETTNEKGKEPKYVFLKYTSSPDMAGEVNTPRLNPVEGESWPEFKERVRDSIAKEGKDKVAKKIQINWKEKEKKCDIIDIPETMFPEIIVKDNSRALLISDLYVLDGCVKKLEKVHEYYWEHTAELSDNGREIPEVMEDHCYYEGKGNYDKVEKIREGVYKTYKEHKEIRKGQGQKCGRIRGDKEREQLAELVLSKEFYDESEKNRDGRNVIIAELAYPYIATVKE